MKQARLLLMATVAVCSFAARAEDRLIKFDDTQFKAPSTSSVSIEDVNSTNCIRYRKRSEKPVSFLLEVSPWGVLSSPDIDGFSTTGPVGSETVVETIDGSGSWMPTMHVGFGVNTAIMDFDFLFGVGYVGNEVFGSGFSEIMLSPRFRLGPHVRFGPFVSLMAVEDAEWYDESDIELEGGGATRAGLHLAVGGSKVFFNLAVSHFDFEYDVNTTKSTWTASSKTLDMSGTAVQMGIYCRF